MNNYTLKKFRLTAIFTLLVSFLCCFIIALTGLNFSANATSVGGTQLNLGTTGLTRDNASDVTTLMRRIANNNTVATYEQLSSAMGTTTRKAAYFASGANQTNISLGGLTWNIAYVSRDRNNDIIVTLWLADTITTDGQNSVKWSVWSSGQNTSAAYPSNMYSSSYVRSQLMGTPYSAEENCTSLTFGAAAPVWRTLRENYGNYIVTPADVAYQETESGVTYSGFGYPSPNECYGTPSEGNVPRDYDYLNGNAKEGYTDWKYDQLWIPSASEVGGVNSQEGIWGATVGMRKGTTHSWTRTGRTVTTSGMHFCDGSTGVTDVGGGVDYVSSLRAVRPAFHLNLRSVYNTVNTLGEIVDHDTKEVNETALNALYSAVNAGTAGNSYEALKETLNNTEGGALTSADIRANNGGNNPTVSLGGLVWNVTYISKDKTGNLIATLWLSGVTGAYNQTSVQWNKWTANNTDFTYPSNMYSSSYIRSVIAGSDYAATQEATFLTSGSPAYIWRQLSTDYGNFFIAPADVAWQETQSAPALGVFSNLGVNDAWGVPAEGNYPSNNFDYLVANPKKGYADWKYDKIWLPSIAEIGYNTPEKIGLWELDAATRTSTVNYWARTGRGIDAGQSFLWNPTSASAVATPVDGSYAVRPAVHFNLTRAEGEKPELDLAELWNSTVQQSIDNGGATPVEFILPENWFAQPHETLGTSFGEGVGFDNGRLLVPEKANIILRLNGRNIDRNLTAPQSYGNVIVIDGGKLEIVDKTSAGAGCITGGYNKGAGGGVRVERGGELVLSGGRITGNIAVDSQHDSTINYSGGGGIFVTGQRSFDTVVKSDTIEATPPGEALSSKLTINGGYISDNQSTVRGGGINALYNSVITINGGKISNNRLNFNKNLEQHYGGGLYVIGVQINMYSGSVTGGYAYSGGGIYVNIGTTFNFYGGEFAGNEAISSGGGVYIWQADFNFYGGSVIENTSDLQGGGIYMSGGSAISTTTSTSGASFYMGGGIISRNYAAQNGAGLYFYNLAGINNGVANGDGKAELAGGVISNNESGVRGGGIYSSTYSKLEINDVEMTGNVAATNGAGIYIYHGELTINGGKFNNNEAGTSGGAMYINNGLVEINGGEFGNNTAGVTGGALYAIFATVENMYRNDCKVKINDGKIHGNSAGAYGGAIHIYNTVELSVNGGEISGNTAVNGGGGISVSNGGTFEMRGGKISGNSSGNGGAIFVKDSTATMWNGTISNNSVSGYVEDGAMDIGLGGGVYVGSNALFTFNGGLITGNKTDNAGAGINIDKGGNCVMNGGTVTGNTAGRWAGGVNNTGNFTMNGGTISDNVAIVNGGAGVNVDGTFTMYNGRIIENQSGNISGAGLRVANAGTFNLAGGIIARNTTLNGVANNVYSVPVINIIGKLRGDGFTSYIGISYMTGWVLPRVLTSDYKTHNPNVDPMTYFFSDAPEYRIGQNASGEMVIESAGSVERRSLVWEYSSDNGATWHDIDTTYFGVYFTGSNYTVRATYNGTTVISAPTSSSVSDAASLPSAFSAVGSYGYTVNNPAGSTTIYVNPTLIFEIMRVSVEWQYSTDNGATWRGVTENTIYYTGKDYKFRAWNSVSGAALALKEDIIAKAVGEYEITLADSIIADYDNTTLTFVIKTRTLSFVWDYSGSAGSKDGAYYWEYDGVSHSPVFVVNGIDDNELIGNIGLEAYYTVAGTQQVLAGAPVNAGRYTVRVRFTDDSPFAGDSGIVFVNGEQTYLVNPIKITAGWRDEADAPCEEANYVFNGENRSVNARLYGLRAGDTVEPVVEYLLAGKKINGEPVNVGVYTARVSLPADCVNYVLGDNYACQLAITPMGVQPVFAGNADNNNQFIWVYNGQSQAPTVTLKGAGGVEIPFTFKYATVAANGTFGAWTDTVPKDADSYVLRISITDTNYTLTGYDRQFKISPMGVNVSWSGRTDGVTGVTGVRDESGRIVWTYDGLEHYLTATARPVTQIIIGGSVVSLDLDVAGGSVTDASFKSATASLKAENAQNYYFVDEKQCSQIFGVNRFTITSVRWSRTADGNTVVNNPNDKPHYVYGTIKGVNGPGYTAEATGINGTVINLGEVYYSVQYDGETVWAADTVNGYEAYADLPAEYSKNYQFSDSISKENNTSQTYFVFFIDPISGDKTAVTPTWIIYNDDSHTTYTTLADFTAASGGDKFTFTYDGTVHGIYAVYINEGAIVEELQIVTDGDGVNAGVYTARLLPSDKYDYSGRRECSFEVFKRGLVLTWAEDADGYFYDKTEKKPEVTVHYDTETGETVSSSVVGLSVQGAINAGPHTAIATVGSNYKILSGDTYNFNIGRVSFSAHDIVWYDADGEEWDEGSGKKISFVYDGKMHAPRATFTSAYGDKLELVVIGASAVGTHWAIAALDSSDLMHNNYYISNPDDATCSFVITRVTVTDVKWAISDGGDDISDNNPAVYTYNGNVQGPVAYFTDGDGVKHALEVSGRMTNAGSYVVYVIADYDFGGAAPSMSYVINPRQLSVVWGNTEVNYNGEAQSPTVAFNDVITGDPVTDDFKGKYTLTNYTNAGTYSAQLYLTDGNYTFVEDGKVKGNTLFKNFVINKLVVSANSGLGWSTQTGWVYDGAVHNPTLAMRDGYSYTLGEHEVVFTFGYTGATSHAGSHTVRAYIASAVWNGKDITENFTLADAIASLAYTITARSVTVDWDWTGAETEGNAHFWYYNGKEQGPAAYMLDDDGNRIKDGEKDFALTVFGKGVNVIAGNYVVTVTAPENYVFTVDGGQTTTATAEYAIRKANINIVWDADGVEGEDYTIENGVFVWLYDGNEHAPKAYIYDDTQPDNKGAQLMVTGGAVNAQTSAYTAYAAQNNGNYTIIGNGSQEFIIRKLPVYILWYGVNGTDKFDWEYDASNTAGFKPDAYLAVKDANGELVRLKVDGQYVKVTVTGAMSQVCQGNETYTATASDTIPNYTFASDAQIEQEFRVVPKVLSGDFAFSWNANGGTEEQVDDVWVYTYTYNGGVQAPVPQTSPYPMNFVTTIRELGTDGTVGDIVPAITEAGTYLMETMPADGNYAVPEGLESVKVVISPCEVQVKWSKEALVYDGTPKAPTAYYEDVKGEKIALEVTVDGAHTDAGEKYEAKAAFVEDDVVNYVLTSEKHTFAIAKREISVNWTWGSEWTDKATVYDGNEHAPVPVPALNNANADDVAGGNLTITYGITLNGTAVSGLTVKDAGTYTVTNVLGGKKAGNYSLKGGVETFTITRKPLTVTSDAQTIPYGSPVPVYTATFTGFVDGEEEIFNLNDPAVSANWISCVYTSRSVPGTYPIKLNKQWLEKTLSNYSLTLNEVLLTVTAADRVVVWQGKLDDFGAEYDGAAYIPTAFYYNGTSSVPIPLTVVYATYDAATDTYTRITDTSFAAIDAGTYYAMAIDPNGTVNLQNSGTSFVIHKRSMTVNISSVKKDVFGDVYTMTDANGDPMTISKHLVWNYVDKQPALRHDLGIELTCEFTFDDYGFAIVGEYSISGSWNSDEYGHNYEVTFVGEAEDNDGNKTLGIYEIVAAEISILKRDDIMTEDEFKYHVGHVGGGQPWIIRLGDKTTVDGQERYSFIGHKGYLGADIVSIYYSDFIYNLNIETAPDPEDEAANGYQPIARPIRTVGKYAINFKVEIPNHKTLYGTWRVLILPENQVARIIFEKDFEIEYGSTVPDNLAKLLYDGGYIKLDNIDVPTYTNYATAYVSNGTGGRVGAMTRVGKYTIEFELNLPEGSMTEYHIAYHAANELNDTNVGRYVITPKKLAIAWGIESSYDYVEGKINMPSPTVSGWLTADPLNIYGEQIKTRPSGSEYEYSAFRVVDNGQEVTILIAASGNFTDAGGHTLRMYVENPNYAIEAGNDVATVSIINKNPTQPPEVEEKEVLPEWVLYAGISAGALLLLMLIIIFVVASRRKTVVGGGGFDDDGFFDDYNDDDFGEE